MKIVHRDHYITVRREGDSSHGHFTHSYAGESGGPEDAHGSRDDLGQTLGQACQVLPHTSGDRVKHNIA